MQKKIFIPVIICVLIGVLVFSGSTSFDNKPPGSCYKYLGIKNCNSKCHKVDNKGKRFEILQDSKLLHVTINLQTAEADQIAKDNGYSTSASETLLCLKCHALYKDMDTEEIYNNYEKFHGIKIDFTVFNSLNFRKY